MISHVIFFQDFPMFDVVIIGSGAAGYTAALYSARYKLKTLIIGNQEGGQTAFAHDVENYPGFKSIKGPELMSRFKEHALEYGVEEKIDEVVAIDRTDDGIFTLKLSLSGDEIQTKAVILTVGTKRRKLGVVGEEKFDGKGVTYCATCDGFFFRGKVVAVIGGGDAAATAALYLAEICPKVYLIVRKEKMRAEPIWVEQLEAKGNVEFLYGSHVKEFHGDLKLERVELIDGKSLDDVAGVFIEIGSTPNTALVDKFELEMTDKGFLVVGKDQSTKIPGLYAAGDVTNESNNFHQISTAIGEASIAANSVFEYLTAKKGGK